jgi:L-threonylcarbamoyladenylate synthase
MTEKISLHALLDGQGASALLKKVAQRVEAGEVFAYPTETIYGIGGRADSDEVRKKIIKIKKRKSVDPLIVLAGTKKDLIDFGVHFPPLAETLAKHFWPGRLTMVLPYGNDGQTMGVRVSDHPFVRALNTLFSMPLFSTSANFSGQPYENDPEGIFTMFDGKIGFMIDAGALPPSPPSTVVSILSDSKITILRDGAVPREKIMSVVVAFLAG